MKAIGETAKPLTLLVERDVVVRNLFAILLTAEGCRVVTAANEDEGLDLFQRYGEAISAILFRKGQFSVEKIEHKSPRIVLLGFEDGFADGLRNVSVEELSTGAGTPQGEFLNSMFREMARHLPCAAD
jgi:hypothetical protein